MVAPLVKVDTHSKIEFYEVLLRQCKALLEGESDMIANAANFSSLLYLSLPDVNWVGFYFYKAPELVLGPFQGKPACVRIPLGKGVCGTAAQLNTTIVVADVHDFEGHIACDADSNSEIVVPLVYANQLIGVLDIDSPLRNRFDDTDKIALEQLVAIFLEFSRL